MPELPEVHTTTTRLKERLPGLFIKDLWTRYGSSHYIGKNTIKNKDYFKTFKKEVVGQVIKNVTRQGKHVLIHLGNDATVLIHMKMTGHLLYGRYRRTTAREKRVLHEEWISIEEGPLRDPFNKFIHLVFTLSNGYHLVLSDMRKFATVRVYSTQSPPKEIKELGPDPLEKTFSFENFLKQLPLSSQKTIKQTLTDQKIVAGVGNIYSDEILWSAGIHPRSRTGNIPRTKLYDIYNSMKDVLKKGIKLKGDSTSDYRQPDGTPGEFHYHHKVYRETGKTCPRRGCKGVIQRIVIGGRSAHFCDHHQILYKPKH